ncbi:MAG: hypothetical protein H0W02_23480, partial [Ktedonobacteraceae bacterium]|nr:hypothetical protein [Ktedonobacteraceae bacterium]
SQDTGPSTGDWRGKPRPTDTSGTRSFRLTLTPMERRCILPCRALQGQAERRRVRFRLFWLHSLLRLRSVEKVEKMFESGHFWLHPQADKPIPCLLRPGDGLFDGLLFPATPPTLIH